MRYNCCVVYCICDVISNPLWHRQQNINRAGKAWGRCVKTLFLLSFMDLLWHVRNKIIYVLSWQTGYLHIPMLFWGLFPELLCNSGNKHIQNILWVHKQFTTEVHTLFCILYSTELCHFDIIITPENIWKQIAPGFVGLILAPCQNVRGCIYTRGSGFCHYVINMGV